MGDQVSALLLQFARHSDSSLRVNAMVKTPINLAEASVEEKKEFLSSFDTVIFDCDGETVLPL